MLKVFRVHHEKGGFMQVFAKDETHAIDKYWEAMEGILGHIEGSCSCCKDKKIFPRHKYVQPTKVEEIKGLKANSFYDE